MRSETISINSIKLLSNEAHCLCFRYDEELGVVYMAARLAGGYAAVRRAVNEVTRS